MPPAHNTGIPSSAGLTLKDCRGTARIGCHTIGVEFSISCDRYGQFTIAFRRLPVNRDTWPLTELHHHMGPTLPWFELTGIDNNGEYTIQTTSAYLTHCPVSSDRTGAWFEPKASASELTLTRTANTSSSLKHHVQFLTIGQRGFQRIEGRTAHGTLYAVAASKVEDFNEITGIVGIENQSIEISSLEQWLSDCEETVKGVLDVLSLAEGRMIRWTARQVYRGDELASILLIGRRATTVPFQPLFWHLDLQPVLDLALTRYSPQLRKSTGIDVAIEWMLMHPPYSEAQLLCCMTALEHLVSVFVESGTGGNVPRAVFRNQVRPRLEKALEDLKRDLVQESGPGTSELCAGVDAIGKKLGLLNLRPLADSAARMLSHYEVPMDGIENALDVIQVRNDIVHRGIYVGTHEPEERLSRQVAVLQELLKRTFMSMLEYEGRYQSFLNGPETREFKCVGRAPQ